MPASRDLLKLAARAYGGMRRVAHRPPWRLAFFAAVSLAASYGVLATGPALNEFRDAHVLGHYETVARDSILHWHQWPLWDPYYCGGMYLLGTPQARFLSPTFLLTLVFGEARGEALAVFAMMTLGLEGAFRYARSRGASCFGALLGAPAFALSGIFALSPYLGWIGFFGFELLPWIALGIRRSLRQDMAGVVIAAAAMAWCVGMGGTYPAPIAALWCGFEAIEYVAAQARRRRWRRLAAGLGFALAAGLLAAGLSAVRLWPIADTLEGAPRIIGGTPGTEWGALAKMLFMAPKADTENGSFYVGGLVMPAFALGILRRRSIPLVVVAGLCVWLATGYATHPSLFAGLRTLPLYESLRYPERFLIPLALAVSAVAARGVSSFEARIRLARRRGRRRRAQIARWTVVAAALAAAANVVLLARVHAIHDDARSLSVAPEVDASRPFHQARGDRWELAYYEPMQRGSLSCWEAYPVPESPLLRSDLPSEESLLDPGAGTVSERSWSPNAIDLDVDLSRPATVAVNQNWNAGWRTNAGEIKSERGLLTVALPAGRRVVSLRFSPRSATGGALASLVALGGLIALAWLAWRGRTPNDAWLLACASLVPILPIGLVAALVHEPKDEGRALAEDGRPVVVDQLPEGATRLGARFASGVTLEGVRISNSRPRPGSDLTLELDWKRDAQIEKGLGIFMHIEPSTGDGMNGDHVLLSSVLDLEDAPPGKILRDVMPLWVPEDAKGKVWWIWVGLWRVRRGGDRVDVAERGQAQVQGQRVLAVTYEVR